jgi:hypothetical protein
VGGRAVRVPRSHRTLVRVECHRQKELLNKRDEIKIQTLWQRRLYNSQVQVSV